MTQLPATNMNRVCCLEARMSHCNRAWKIRGPSDLSEEISNCKMGSNSSHKAGETRVDIVISFWVARVSLRGGVAQSTAVAFRPLGTAQGRGCLRSLQSRCEVCERMNFMQELRRLLVCCFVCGGLWVRRQQRSFCAHSVDLKTNNLYKHFSAIYIYICKHPTIIVV